jgi:hypothetical protein
VITISPVSLFTVEILTTSASSAPKFPKRRKESVANAVSVAFKTEKVSIAGE